MRNVVCILLPLLVAIISTFAEDYTDFDMFEGNFEGPTIRDVMESSSLSVESLKTLHEILEYLPGAATLRSDQDTLISTESNKQLEEVGMAFETEITGENEKISPDIGGGTVTLPGGGQPKQGLSSGCSNKLCDTFYYLTTCKTFNLGLRKKCAGYLMGSLFGCSNYPSPDQFYDAPSTCLTEYTSFFAMLAKSLSGKSTELQDKIKSYLLYNFESNTCERQCYQNYQLASNSLYLNCINQINTYNKTYPLAYALSNFQEFRNQACDRNYKNQTCFALVSNLLPASTSTPLPPMNPSVLSAVETTTSGAETFEVQPETLEMIQSATQSLLRNAMHNAVADGIESIITPSTVTTDEESTTTTTHSMSIQDAATATATKPNLLTDYYCNYHNLSATVYNSTIALENYKTLKTVCTLLASLDCCTGSLIQMIQQNQIAALLKQPVTLFPPCLLNYLNFYCPAVSLSKMCYHGATATQTTIVGNFTIFKTSANFPDVYNQKSVLNALGLITGVLGQLGLTKQPYHFNNVKYPFQVTLSGYTYYAANGKPLVNTMNPPGQLYYPPGEDYKNATKGTFTFQLTMQNMNTTNVQYMQGVLKSVNFAYGIGKAFGSNPFTSTKTSTKPASYFKADVNHINSAPSLSMLSMMTLSSTAIVIVVSSLAVLFLS